LEEDKKIYEEETSKKKIFLSAVELCLSLPSTLPFYSFFHKKKKIQNEKEKE